MRDFGGTANLEMAMQIQDHRIFDVSVILLLYPLELLSALFTIRGNELIPRQLCTCE